MKKIYLVALATLISLSVCAEEKVFEYSSFYNSLSSESISSSYLKFLPEGMTNACSSHGISEFNGIKEFHFIHEADAETEKALLLAYGDGISMSLKMNDFFVGAVNNPRYDKSTSPLKYTIFGNNKTNICDVVIYSHRVSPDTIKIEAVFREYAIK